jgi:hypothetical protein
MAVKVKKTTAKKTTTKKAQKKVIEEVADSIIENTEIEKAEVNQEVLEELKKEPIMETCSEPEYTPTAEEADKAIDGFETMNGDPAVIAPKKEEVKVTEIHEEAIKQTFKHINNRKGAIDRSFGYSWNGMEMD